MADEQQLAHAVDALTGPGELPSELIGALSHLVRTDLEAVTKAWRNLTVERRREVLGQLGTSERENMRLDFNAIYEMAFTDDEPSIRLLAVESVVAENGAGILAAVARLAEHDPDSSVQEAALRCLAPFALMAEVGELDEAWADRLRSMLLKITGDAGASLGARREALSAVGYLDDAAVERRIRSAFDEDELHLWAIQAMGHTANPDWISDLLGEAANLDPTVRQAVAYACGDIADEQAAEGVAEMVDDPEIGVRLAAIWALGQIGGEEARETLIYTLDDEDEEIRKAAEEALNELEEAEDPLGM